MSDNSKYIKVFRKHLHNIDYSWLSVWWISLGLNNPYNNNNRMFCYILTKNIWMVNARNNLWAYIYIYLCQLVNTLSQTFRTVIKQLKHKYRNKQSNLWVIVKTVRHMFITTAEKTTYHFMSKTNDFFHTE